MKKRLIMSGLCVISTWTFFISHKPDMLMTYINEMKQEKHLENKEVKKDNNVKVNKVTNKNSDKDEIKKHIISKSSVQSIEKEQSFFKKNKIKYIYIDGVKLIDITDYKPQSDDMISKDPYISHMNFCYNSFSRNSDQGIHYEKIYSSFEKAKNDAKNVHMTSPYNTYKTYTIEGLPQCGYKIYFIK